MSYSCRNTPSAQSSALETLECGSQVTSCTELKFISISASASVLWKDDAAGCRSLPRLLFTYLPQCIRRVVAVSVGHKLSETSDAVMSHQRSVTLEGSRDWSPATRFLCFCNNHNESFENCDAFYFACMKTLLISCIISINWARC